MKRVPPPPPVDPRTRRYPATTMAYARRLREGGWSIPAIVAFLERELGHRPHEKTVLKWVNEQHAENQRRFKRESDARRRNGQPRQTQRRRELSDAELLELRGDGLTFTTIAKLAQRFYGVDITENQVRYRLRALGVPVNPNRSRAGRATAARKKAAA